MFHTLKRVAGIGLGIVGGLFVLVGAYWIWLGWYARPIGIFVGFVGLMLILVSYLNTPQREKSRS